MTQNFVALVLLQGANYLLPLLSFPFLLRVLGVERWGLISFGYATIQYFVLFTDFGFNLSATKYISLHRDEREVINRYLNSAFICRLFLAIISFLILLFLVTVFDKFNIEARFFLLYFGIVIGNVMFPMWYFQGMEKMKFITAFNIVAKLVTFIPFFIFIRQPDHYILVPFFYSVGYILAGLISIYMVYFKEKMKWFIPSFAEIKFALIDSATYFLSRVSVYLFTTSNTFVIGLVCGNIAVGYYSAAEKLYQAYNQLLIPFNGVLFPHMAKTRDVAFFKRLMKYIVPANVALITLILLCSSWFIQLIYGVMEQPDSLYVFRILMCACVVTIPSVLMGYPFLAAMGYPKYTNWTVIITSMVHVSGLFLLYVLGFFSIYTVAMMVVLAEFLLFAFRLRGIRKYKLFQQI